MNKITKNELLQCFEYDKKHNDGLYTKLYVQQVMDQYMTHTRNVSTSVSLAEDKLGNLDISSRSRHALMRYGITNQEQLFVQSIKSLQMIPGIGKDAAMKIKVALNRIGKQLISEFQDN